MKILVTGAKGFLGQAVAAELQARGHAVTALTRQDADVRDSAAMQAACAHMDTIFHIAGNIRTPATDLPALHHQVNLGGTINLLAGASVQGVRRFVYVSTCEVYGALPGEQVAEAASKMPANAYAESKWLAEQACGAMAGRLLTVTILRPSYILGKGMYSGRLLPRLVDMALAGKVTMKASGGNDYVHVQDVAEGVVTLGTREQPAPLEAFNLGSGRFTLTRELFQIVQELTGVPFEEEDAACPPFSLDMTKAAAAGFIPRRSLRDAVETFFPQRVHGTAR